MFPFSVRKTVRKDYTVIICVSPAPYMWPEKTNENSSWLGCSDSLQLSFKKQISCFPLSFMNKVLQILVEFKQYKTEGNSYPEPPSLETDFLLMHPKVELVCFGLVWFWVFQQYNTSGSCNAQWFILVV